MKAVTIHEFGGPEVLQLEEIEKPEPGVNEILIEVHASSLNPVDVKSISKDSDYKSLMRLPATQGMDVAGVVEMVGEGVTSFQVGDKVFGQASVLKDGSGAFAEFAVTSSDSIAIMPSNLNYLEAASLPLAASSAYEAIMNHIKLKPGQKILVHGGSGGIGSFAIQLAKYAGAFVATTATGKGIDFVKKLGADEVINYYGEESFEDQIWDYDAVLDTVGGDTYSKSFQVLRRGGIIVSMLSKPDENKMNQYGVAAVLEMTRVNRKVLSEIARLIENNVLRVNIARTYSLDQTRDAYKAKDEEKILGKIAIEVKP